MLGFECPQKKCYLHIMVRVGRGRINTGVRVGLFGGVNCIGGGPVVSQFVGAVRDC